MSCNSLTLKGYNASCDTSKGGIQEVYLIEYDQVSSVTVSATTAGTNTGATSDYITAIALSGTSKFKTYKFRKETASMTSNLTVDNANGLNYVATELTMLFTRMEAVKRLEVVNMSMGEVAAIVLDSNGHYWYLGYNEGVTASAGAGQTGQAKSDGNYYSVTLTDNSDEFPYEVDPSIISALLA